MFLFQLLITRIYQLAVYGINQFLKLCPSMLRLIIYSYRCPRSVRLCRHQCCLVSSMAA